MAELLREDLVEERDQEESDSGETWEEEEDSDSGETEEEEEDSDSRETDISRISQMFETVPDKLFDYGLNRLPPELENLESSDFLEQPEQPNLALLPKHILARICEMLPPKAFGTLAQTCRLMRWRMIKWCQCYVKDLTIDVCKAGRTRSGDVRIFLSPEMAYSLYMKHIVFERVNIVIKFGTERRGIDDEVAFLRAVAKLEDFLNELAAIFRPCRNIKNLEFTVVESSPFVYTFYAYGNQPPVRKLLRDTRATHFNMEHEEGNYMMRTFTRYRVEHHAIPSIDKDQQGLRPPHMDITIREPNEIYLMDVPVATIDQLLRHFLDVEKHDIHSHQYYYVMEEREELDRRLRRIMTWAESTKGLESRWVDTESDLQVEYYDYKRGGKGVFTVLVQPEVLIWTRS